MQYEPGMLARSLAGHDAGSLYVIIKTEGGLVCLADGRIRTLERPKRKKKKHIQLIRSIPAEIAEKLAEGKRLSNEDIKRAVGGSAHVESRCN